MDQPWQSEYKPSDCAKHPIWDASSTRPISFNAERLQKNTRAIALIPYEPGLWILRSQLLLALGYPELAAGDAYKARLLIEAAKKPASVLGSNVHLQYGMCLWLRWHERFDSGLAGLGSQSVDITNIANEVAERLNGYEQQAWSILIIALQHLDCLQENQKLAREAEQKFGELPADDDGPWSQNYQIYLRQLLEAKQEACKAHQELVDDPYTLKKVMLNGAVAIRRYPWIRSDLHETKRNVNSLNTLVAQRSRGRCRVHQSNILCADLGVFAARHISKDEQIFVDLSYTVATSEDGRCLLCLKQLPSELLAERFCCDKHAKLANDKLLDANRQRHTDFSELESLGLVKNTTRNLKSDLLLLKRFLEISVRQAVLDPQTHPLLVPEIANITANYQGTVILPWNFMQHIVLPFRILQDFGIDIFADLRFDTWVIHTILYRINNNQVGASLDPFPGQESPAMQGVFPCYSLFNHSCEANIVYEEQRTEAAIVLKTSRDVEKGEELFICYDLGMEQEGLNVFERRQCLKNWMGDGGCGCGKCARELREAETMQGMGEMSLTSS
ncbi:MAG: hypothetical protein Q9159_002670 [Coniocarpon cinnabarinum]